MSILMEETKILLPGKPIELAFEVARLVCLYLRDNKGIEAEMVPLIDEDNSKTYIEISIMKPDDPDEERRLILLVRHLSLIIYDELKEWIG